MLAVGELAQRRRRRRRAARPDRSDRPPDRSLAIAQLAVQPALADARVQHRRLAARVGADQQDRVGLLDAGDRRC